MSSSPAVIGFIDRDYRYKLVATQIPHYAGLARIPYTARMAMGPVWQLKIFIRNYILEILSIRANNFPYPFN